METGFTQNSFYPAQLGQVNNQLLSQENESVLSLNKNDRAEEYREPFNEVGNQLLVTHGNQKPISEREEYDEKFPELLSGDADVSRQEGEIMDTNFDKENIPSLEEKDENEKKKKKKQQESIKTDKKSLEVKISDQGEPKNSRDHLELVTRMSSYLKPNQKEFYTINVQSGCFNDSIQILLDGCSQVPLTSQFQTILFGKKARILCKNNLIGSLEGNKLGSMFNVYSLNFEEIERKLIASIAYDTTITFKKVPRKVEIYIADPSFPELPKNENKNLKEIYEQDPNGSRVMMLSMPEPRHIYAQDKCFVPLNTKQRVLPSIHNCAFDYDKQRVMRLFKISQDQFQMGIKGPMSPMIAFCYLLSSFSFKWMSQ